MSATQKKVDSILRHIDEVQRNCRRLAERLIENGEEDLALQLVRNSLVHDMSKLSGIEWECLSINDGDSVDETRLEIAISNHNKTNPHHPEYWDGIKNMPDVYVAEMVCDWKARSAEFGTSLLEWVNDGAALRYGFTKRDKIYRKIVGYINLIVEEKFK